MMRVLTFTVSLLLFIALAGIGGGVYVFWHYGRGLPDFRQLETYTPDVMTRIYAGDGRLVTEYAIEKRVFVPFNAMPKVVVNAFLSAEDQRFFEHAGVDVMGVLRAALTNLRHAGSGRRPVGASTITQQVAKNFLLTNEVSFARKVKEAILALRIEQSFSKEHILELYLNEIYLGRGSYGVAAAAMNYFNKSLDELTIADAAYLAALPKAPNNYNPQRFPEAAVSRRNWVIGRMAEDGHIAAADAEVAMGDPLLVVNRAETEFLGHSLYFSEDVRRELVARYGERALYKGGLAVRTTLEPHLQEIATRSLQDGLIAYDRRHGWRGPLGHIELDPSWGIRLRDAELPKGLHEKWQRAVVLNVSPQAATIGFVGGKRGTIPYADLRWARPHLPGQEVGAAPKSPADVVKPGDVVAVEPTNEAAGVYALRQIPEVDGALIAMDPHTGRVLAMVGGFSHERSEFNRATQALRQPGSSFKPFVYLTALENGYKPTDLILDAPFVLEVPGQAKWKPQNYGGDFYGPTTLRIGIEKSRNLMTVRLAEALGMDKVVATARRFGIADRMLPVLSMALGAGETTVLQLTSAYAMLVNGGKRIVPTLIDRIQDRDGKTIYRHDARPCEGCSGVFWTGDATPELPDTRAQIADPISAYQIVHILEGVVERGTGRRISEVGKPLAGKTGTSNDSMDTWFVGFSPDLVVGVFIGFDEPKSLGKKETGSSVSAPVFKDFMTAALKDKPGTPFRIPPGARLIRINHDTGLRAEPGDTNVIFEAFRPGETPGSARTVTGSGAPVVEEAPGDTGVPKAGGLY
jgi:penicillin-binding protein 1A